MLLCVCMCAFISLLTLTQYSAFFFSKFQKHLHWDHGSFKIKITEDTVFCITTKPRGMDFLPRLQIRILKGCATVNEICFLRLKKGRHKQHETVLTIDGEVSIAFREFCVVVRKCWVKSGNGVLDEKVFHILVDWDIVWNRDENRTVDCRDSLNNFSFLRYNEIIQWDAIPFKVTRNELFFMLDQALLKTFFYKQLMTHQALPCVHPSKGIETRWLITWRLHSLNQFLHNFIWTLRCIDSLWVDQIHDRNSNFFCTCFLPKLARQQEYLKTTLTTRYVKRETRKKVCEPVCVEGLPKNHAYKRRSNSSSGLWDPTSFSAFAESRCDMFWARGWLLVNVTSPTQECSRIGWN